MKTRGAKHVGRLRSAGGSGLATNGGVREGFYKVLQSEGVVPCLCEPLMLLMQFQQAHVMVTNEVAAPLLNAKVIVAPVERVETCLASERQTQLEAHLRVTHEVAVLFA